MNHQRNHGVEHETAQDEKESAQSVFISQHLKKSSMHCQQSKETKVISSVNASYKPLAGFNPACWLV